MRTSIRYQTTRSVARQSRSQIQCFLAAREIKTVTHTKFNVFYALSTHGRRKQGGVISIYNYKVY